MGRLSSLVQALREVRAQRVRIGELERELQRVSPQLAALEHRVEQLQRAHDAVEVTATAPERAEARQLVEEVRAEHARVRARISAATVFEERLRVLEQHLGIDSATGRPLRPEQ